MMKVALLTKMNTFCFCLRKLESVFCSPLSILFRVSWIYYLYSFSSLLSGNI